MLSEPKLPEFTKQSSESFPLKYMTSLQEEYEQI